MYQDALAAFKSVVDEEEVKAFMALFPNDRENRIDQLTKIVSGIRLFNKDCNMGGVGISDRKYKIKINSNKTYLQFY